MKPWKLIRTQADTVQNLYFSHCIRIRNHCMFSGKNRKKNIHIIFWAQPQPAGAHRHLHHSFFSSTSSTPSPGPQTSPVLSCDFLQLSYNLHQWDLNIRLFISFPLLFLFSTNFTIYTLHLFLFFKSITEFQPLLGQSCTALTHIFPATCFNLSWTNSIGALAVYSPIAHFSFASAVVDTTAATAATAVAI